MPQACSDAMSGDAPGRERGARWRCWCGPVLIAVLGTGCGAPESELTDAVAPPTLIAAPPEVPTAPPDGWLGDGDGATTRERLMVMPPDGWTLYADSHEPARRLTEFRPEGLHESTAEGLMVEAFTADPLPEPLDALATVAAAARERCPDFEHFNTFAGEENNYATGTALMICRDDPDGAGARISVVKAIRGNDRAYLIRRTRSVPALGAPPENDDAAIAELHRELADVLGAMSLYVRSVALCDDARTEHACDAPPAPRS
jgi:hypothetical protein